MQNRRMRLLRDKHGISINELSRYCDISPQRLSQIELCEGTVTAHMNQLVDTAFSYLILARKNELAALARDFHSYRETLLEFAEEDGEA